MYNPFYNYIFDQWEFIISSSSSINVEGSFFVTTFPFFGEDITTLCRNRYSSLHNICDV